MIRTVLCCLAAFLSFFKPSLHAERHGRVDAGPIIMRVKVQESGQTVSTLDMGGARVDATFQLLEDYGFVAKPFIFGASGDGDLISGGIGLGHYTPITEKVTVTPTIGWSFSNLKTTIDLPMFGFTRQREKFKSNSFNLGFEFAYQFNKCWYFTWVYQYGFARTHTTIGSLISAKGRSQGSNFGFILDYYFSECWVATAAIAYNNSLSREKHGIEGYGAKLGLGYWY